MCSHVLVVSLIPSYIEATIGLSRFLYKSNSSNRNTNNIIIMRHEFESWKLGGRGRYGHYACY